MLKVTVLLQSCLWIAFLAAGLVAMSGCGGYTLRGKVIRGTASSIEVVHEVDPRLKQPGIANLEVRVVRDPSTLNRHVAGQSRTDGEGAFATYLSGFGAGWMEEQWLIQTSMSGYQNAEQIMKLPPKGSQWRLLITVTPGAATPVDTESLTDEADKYK